jgi:hypothetical protein
MKFNERLQNSWRYHVATSGNAIYQVQIPDTSRKNIVNLGKLDCDCTNFHEYGCPCTHAIIACRHEGLDPFDFTDWTYSVEAYRMTYEHFLKPISTKNLPSDPTILPPIAKK